MKLIECILTRLSHMFDKTYNGPVYNGPVYQGPVIVVNDKEAAIGVAKELQSIAITNAPTETEFPQTAETDR